jgi:DUF1680 family protein
VAYHLPNDRAYAETCASVGLIFFARRMIELDGSNSVYGDVMERALYNTVLSSFGLDGRSFFYSNPQEAYRDVCGKADGTGDPALNHVKITRQKWYGCACCPPNAARLLASLQKYVVSYDAPENTVRCQLLLPGVQTQDGPFGRLIFETETKYPWDGKISITIISCELKNQADFAIRIPAWAKGKVRDVTLPEAAVRVEEEGFLRVRHAFRPGDSISFILSMEVRAIRAHIAVRADAGMVALERGPLVYCLEQTDNEVPLYEMMLSKEDIAGIKFKESSLFGGTVMLSGDAYALHISNETELYHGESPLVRRTRFTAIPYFQWSNRGETDMQIWIRERL